MVLCSSLGMGWVNKRKMVFGQSAGVKREFTGLEIPIQRIDMSTSSRINSYLLELVVPACRM